MSTGRVDAGGRPRLPVTLPDGTRIDAIIDTGFEGAVQLPIQFFDPSVFTPLYRQRYELGDGTEVFMPVCSGPITVGNVGTVANVVFSDSEQTLIGVDFLAAYVLTIDFPGGTVTLAPPSAPPG